MINMFLCSRETQVVNKQGYTTYIKQYIQRGNISELENDLSLQKAKVESTEMVPFIVPKIVLSDWHRLFFNFS